jgi:hypothetical protein
MASRIELSIKSRFNDFLGSLCIFAISTVSLFMLQSITYVKITKCIKYFGAIVLRWIMEKREMINLLTAFLSGRVDIGKFQQQLGDVLFELRQDATPNEDKQLLSKIQLYLHEFDEGNRDIHEVYIAAQAALDLLKPVRRVVPTNFARLFEPPTEPGTVSTTTASPAPEFDVLTTRVPI